MSSPTPLPAEIYRSAEKGELQKVIKWLRKEGPVDALCPVPSRRGPQQGDTATWTTAETVALLHAHPVVSVALLHAATSSGQLELVKVLLKRGASIDLPTSLGCTALMDAAYRGHLSILRVLLQHSANPDLQDIKGQNALMSAADGGQVECVQALLHAKANTELLDKDGHTALHWADGAFEGELSWRTLPPSGHVDGEPATNMVVDAQLAEIEVHLLQAFRATPAESDGTIVEWVGKRVKPNVPNVQLARLVVRSLLEATCAETPSSTKLHAAIKDRAKLLRKFLQVGKESEQMTLMFNSLYEVQDYCARMDWPEKLMKKLFYQLYEADVILEEAFTVWREDTSDQGPNKMKALVQVNEFLQWLETTEEEGEDGED